MPTPTIPERYIDGLGKASWRFSVITAHVKKI